MAQAPPRRATVIDLLGSYPRALHLGEITSRLGETMLTRHDL